jgi:hypothetical protein
MRIRRRLPHVLDLPALAAFARGYLHEDVIVEHGSGPDAVAAFARDASADERRQLIEELERLARALEGKPAASVSRFFTDTLRASWTPTTIDDLRSLIARIRATDAR